jgi:DNA-directed RNA polymerase specialized sigma subunit
VAEGWFRRTEGALYGYYRRQEEVKRLQFLLGETVERVRTAREEMRRVLAEVGDLPSSARWGDKIQENQQASPVERQTEKLIAALSAIRQTILDQEALALRYRIQLTTLEQEADLYRFALAQLGEQEREVVAQVYGVGRSFRSLGVDLHCSHSTISRMRQAIVHKIALVIGQDSGVGS